MFYAVEKDGKIKSVMAARRPAGALGIIPGNISKDDYEFLKSTPSNDPITGEPINVISVDEVAKNAALAEKSKAEQIATAYKTMSDEVDAKLYEVFRTKKADYATAEWNTWNDMLTRPAAYSSAGMKVDHQINNADGVELFSPGSALDTADKVLAYATRKIQLAQEYGVFRVQKLQEFRNQKATIENS